MDTPHTWLFWSPIFGLSIRTLIINKVAIKGVQQGKTIYGPVHAAVIKAVIDCIFEGFLPKELADDLLILASVFVEKEAVNQARVYDFNCRAARQAIERAANGWPKVEEVLAKIMLAVLWIGL